jgi:putative transposase
MPRPALRIKVPAGDQREIRRLLSGGIRQVRVVLRALALLRLAQGMAAPQVAGLLGLTPQAIRKIAHRYVEGGLDRAPV